MAATWIASITPRRPSRTPTSTSHPPHRWRRFAPGSWCSTPERTAECLSQLSSVACIELVKNRFPEACGLPSWVGTVPPGGYCLGSVNCAEPAYQCVDSSNACGRSCEPVPVEATSEPIAEGEPCGPIDDCDEGAFCKPAISNSFEGVCQWIEPDQRCSGSWECPWPYACVEDQPGQGVCTAGRRAGESCTVRDFPRLNGWTDHDCAATTQCKTAEGASTGTCVAADSWRGLDAPRDAYRAVTEGSFCRALPGASALRLRAILQRGPCRPRSLESDTRHRAVARPQRSLPSVATRRRAVRVGRVFTRNDLPGRRLHSLSLSEQGHATAGAPRPSTPSPLLRGVLLYRIGYFTEKSCETSTNLRAGTQPAARGVT